MIIFMFVATAACMRKINTAYLLIYGVHCSYGMRQGLCDDVVYVCPSVCLSHHLAAVHSCGEFAVVGDISRERRVHSSSGIAARRSVARPSAANASSFSFLAGIGS